MTMKQIYMRSLMVHIAYAVFFALLTFVYVYVVSQNLLLALAGILPWMLFLLYRYFVMFRAGFMLAADQPEPALKHLNHVLILAPGSMIALTLRAQAKNMLKDYAGAIEDCTDGIASTRRRRLMRGKNRRKLLVSFYATRLAAYQKMKITRPSFRMPVCSRNCDRMRN